MVPHSLLFPPPFPAAFLHNRKKRRKPLAIGLGVLLKNGSFRKTARSRGHHRANGPCRAAWQPALTKAILSRPSAFVNGWKPSVITDTEKTMSTRRHGYGCAAAACPAPKGRCGHGASPEKSFLSPASKIIISRAKNPQKAIDFSRIVCYNTLCWRKPACRYSSVGRAADS